MNLPCSTELRVISSSLRASTVTLGKGSRLLVTWAVRLCIVHCMWEKIKKEEKNVWDSSQTTCSLKPEQSNRNAKTSPQRLKEGIKNTSISGPLKRLEATSTGPSSKPPSAGKMRGQQPPGKTQTQTAKGRTYLSLMSVVILKMTFQFRPRVTHRQRLIQPKDKTLWHKLNNIVYADQCSGYTQNLHSGKTRQHLHRRKKHQHISIIYLHL